MAEPIIIIGAARSGTKFLRSVLSASTAVREVKYDVNYIWRYGQEDLPHDMLAPQTLDDRAINYIRTHLEKQAHVRGRDDLVMVEKTVGNTLRVPFVYKVFPEARYIHLLRDGRAVSESTMRLWQAPPDYGSLLKKLAGMPWGSLRYVRWFAGNFIKGLKKGRGGGHVWGPRYQGMEEDAEKMSLAGVCATQWRKSVECGLEGFKEIPEEQVFELHYTDLVSSPERVQEMIDFLKLPDGETVMEFYKANVRPGNDDKWKEKLSPEDRKEIEEITRPVLERLGYDITPEAGA